MDIVGILVGIGAVVVFLIWIINPDHFNKINDAGRKNLDDAGARIKGATSWLEALIGRWSKK